PPDSYCDFSALSFQIPTNGSVDDAAATARGGAGVAGVEVAQRVVFRAADRRHGRIAIASRSITRREWRIVSSSRRGETELKSRTHLQCTDFAAVLMFVAELTDLLS